ncbi:MAG: helix-hairpin-helix domain-containing protein [Chloroflexi bacterium]|nr:helix-hairpin-helix domain-containing protein [Chloroflexota bacterium]
MASFIARHRLALMLTALTFLLSGAALFWLRRPPGESLHLVQSAPRPTEVRCQDDSLLPQAARPVVHKPAVAGSTAQPEGHSGISRKRGTESPATVEKSSTAVSTAKVNINQATAEELQKLSGIGPTLAKRIVEYRDAQGPFRSVDDLVQVKGIGPVMLSRLDALISVR